MSKGSPARDKRGRVRRLLGLHRPPAAGLLGLLIVVAVLLLGGHFSQKYLGEPQEFTFDLGAERGFGEFFQYIQILWAAIMLVMLALRTRAGVYIAWTLVCVYFVLDDGLQIHERAGWAALDAFPEVGINAMHLGELAWTGTVGLILIAIVALGYRRADPEARAVSRVIAALFGVLIFFGVVVDGIHHLFLEYPVFDAPMTAIEDGGEIVAMSFMVAFLFAVTFLGHTVSHDRRDPTGS